ncbi:MAG: tRNA (cytidine(56)-2'-O)-methyltransferase [Candidatus Bathyarchaeota archaeon]|nr:tRNA (cytidine(56)-2'-O)-methyltransferase [Candidatus Bathyarchaeota archaeon]
MKKWKVYVLRLSHRPSRDKRVTTHLFLAARAFGADGAFYSGQRDDKIERSVKKVSKSWGGSFEVEYAEDWRKLVKQWNKDGGETLHLTVYGLPLQDVIGHVTASPKDKLVVVGGAKVPGAVYELADWNVSVTSQPHSEVSALSVFLHELFEGRELSKSYEDSGMRVVPQARGKRVMRTKHEF